MKKWVFFLVVLSWSIALLAGPEIHIREKNLVPDKSDFNLSDIADFKNLTAEQNRELANLRLSPMPRFGDSIHFTAGRLSQILREKLLLTESARNAEIRLVIPNRVQIENQGMRISAQDIEPLVIGHLKATCADCDFKVRNMRIPPLKDLPPTTRWEVQFNQPLQRGTLGANLVVHQTNGGRENHWLSLQVAVYRKVPIARRTLNIGQRLQVEDFEMQSRDVTFATDAIPGTEDLVGSVARVGVPVQGVIYANALAREQAVSRGEIVKVVAGGKSWTVSAPAVAQQSGYVGDMIRLINSTSQKAIMGQIIARGVVRVE